MPNIFTADEARAAGMSPAVFKAFEEQARQLQTYAGRPLRFALSGVPPVHTTPLMGWTVDLQERTENNQNSWVLNVAPFMAETPGQIFIPERADWFAVDTTINPQSIAHMQAARVAAVVAAERISKVALRVVPPHDRNVYKTRLQDINHYVHENLNYHMPLMQQIQQAIVSAPPVFTHKKSSSLDAHQATLKFQQAQSPENFRNMLQTLDSFCRHGNHRDKVTNLLDLPVMRLLAPPTRYTLADTASMQEVFSSADLNLVHTTTLRENDPQGGLEGIQSNQVAQTASDLGMEHPRTPEPAPASRPETVAASPYVPPLNLNHLLSSNAQLYPDNSSSIAPAPIIAEPTISPASPANQVHATSPRESASSSIDPGTPSASARSNRGYQSSQALLELRDPPSAPLWRVGSDAPLTPQDQSPSSNSSRVQSPGGATTASLSSVPPAPQGAYAGPQVTESQEGPMLVDHLGASPDVPARPLRPTQEPSAGPRFFPVVRETTSPYPSQPDFSPANASPHPSVLPSSRTQPATELGSMASVDSVQHLSEQGSSNSHQSMGTVTVTPQTPRTNLVIGPNLGDDAIDAKANSAAQAQVATVPKIQAPNDNPVVSPIVPLGEKNETKQPSAKQVPAENARTNHVTFKIEHHPSGAPFRPVPRAQFPVRADAALPAVISVEPKVQKRTASRSPSSREDQKDAFPVNRQNLPISGVRVHKVPPIQKTLEGQPGVMLAALGPARVSERPALPQTGTGARVVGSRTGKPSAQQAERTRTVAPLIKPSGGGTMPVAYRLPTTTTPVLPPRSAGAAIPRNNFSMVAGVSEPPGAVSTGGPGSDAALSKVLKPAEQDFPVNIHHQMKQKGCAPSRLRDTRPGIPPVATNLSTGRHNIPIR